MNLNTFELGKHVVGFVATSKIDKEMVERVHRELDEALQVYDKVNWYCENASGEEATFAAIMEDIAYKIKNKDRFYKIAIVSEGSKAEIITKIECMFVSSQCEFFAPSDRLEALNWVSN